MTVKRVSYTVRFNDDGTWRDLEGFDTEGAAVALVHKLESRGKEAFVLRVTEKEQRA